MKTRRFSRRRIIRRFGQWAVTSCGLENLTGPCQYDVDRAVLGHPWWSDHMRQKSWVDAADFDAALSFARQHFGITVGGDVLW
ncbi:MAG: hypothetical protein A2Y77_16755 [Planctomycetes bacterium RBG_13_62_9]|nr:MAG: hypothetical protein A2Y77_16755 [Planctomycetes bacterium RBG_13_62_9]